MANQAQKKFDANADFWTFYMQLALLIVNGLYFTVHIYSAYFSDARHGLNWGWYDYLWVIIYLFVERKTYGMIENELRTGITP